MSIVSLAILPPDMQTLTTNSAYKELLIFALFSSSLLQLSLVRLPSSFICPEYFTPYLVDLTTVKFTPVYPQRAAREAFQRRSDHIAFFSEKFSLLLGGTVIIFSFFQETLLK